MKTRFILAAVFAVAGSFASAQDYVQAQIDALFAQGYTHFSVQNRSGSVQIEAYSPSGQELTLVLDNATGQIVSSRTETSSSGSVQGSISEIEERAATTSTTSTYSSDDRYETVTLSTGETVTVEVDDDDSSDDVAGTSSGTYESHDRYERSDDHEDDREDDHYDDHGSDHDDD